MSIASKLVQLDDRQLDRLRVPARLPSCAALLVLPYIAAAAWPQAADEAAAVLIAHCAQTVERKTRGLTALEARCPGLTAALSSSGYLPHLADAHELRPGELAQLHSIQRRYQQPPTALALKVDALEPILAQLRKQQNEPRGGWLERIERWLRAMLERQQANSDSWLARWLRDIQIPARASGLLVQGAILLIVALALAVLLNELRAAGMFRRNRPGPARSTAPSNTGELAGVTVVPADLDAAAPEARPSLLLRMLVATLVNRGRLPAQRGLTHSELALRAHIEDPAQRHCFQRVARLAERLTYGSHSHSAEELEEVVRAGRSLYAQLDGAR